MVAKRYEKVLVLYITPGNFLLFFFKHTKNKRTHYCKINCTANGVRSNNASTVYTAYKFPIEEAATAPVKAPIK